VNTPRRTVAAPQAWGSTAAAVVLVVLVLLAAAGCGRQAPSSHRLEGTYIVHGFFPHRDYGAACRPADAGYPDIRAGATTVTVRDQSAAILGTAALRGGTLRESPLWGKDDDCVFSFSLTVPERDAYRIEVEGRGSVPFTRSDLEKSNWKADLTIGAYTMFGGI
jgi:hypothetical protein